MLSASQFQVLYYPHVDAVVVLSFYLYCGSCLIVSTCVDAKFACMSKCCVWIVFHIWRNPHSVELINTHTKRERERESYLCSLFCVFSSSFLSFHLYTSYQLREREGERERECECTHLSSACLRLLLFLSHTSSLIVYWPLQLAAAQQKAKC